MKSNNDIKIIAAFIITILILVLFYFGAYLPLRKSQIHINAVLNLQNGKVRTLDDMNNLFNSVLNFYSPVGQDETTQYYLGILLNIINQQSNKDVIDVLARQAENQMEPILKAGKGFNFNQNLYTLGSIYKITALKSRDLGYYQKAVNIFNNGLKYSPNRLIFLMGLFDIYSANTDDKEKALETGKTILKYYPNEKRVEEYLMGK
ncbi:MAG: hypothetical protein AAB396_01685, partial [Patescibacteria group bacterium]